MAIAGGALLPLSLGAKGQGTTHRIGLLAPGSRTDAEVTVNLLRLELNKLGWTDGRNIVLLEPRIAEGRNERLPALAAELVAQNPDVIVVQSVPGTRALMQATKTIAIVMYAVGNPVEVGLVADFRNPGGNVTGLSILADETLRKLLQLLKEAAPRVRSVALFVNPTNEAVPPLLKVMRADTAGLGMRLQVIEVSAPGDFEPAFAAIIRENTESIMLPPEPLILSKRDTIAEFAQRHGLLLALAAPRRLLPAGGLIAYGPTRDEYAQIAARYVDKILKGAKPGALPIQQPTKFELGINLKTAEALGLTIPQSLRLRAEEAIQ
jgi:putative ABC transport system substrate-binding protein